MWYCKRSKETAEWAVLLPRPPPHSFSYSPPPFCCCYNLFCICFFFLKNRIISSSVYNFWFLPIVLQNKLPKLVIQDAVHLARQPVYTPSLLLGPHTLKAPGLLYSSQNTTVLFLPLVLFTPSPQNACPSKQHLYLLRPNLLSRLCSHTLELPVFLRSLSIPLKGEGSVTAHNTLLYM